MSPSLLRSSLLSLLDRLPLHYSYFALSVSSLNIFINGSGASYGIGYFAKSWETDLSISKTELSLAWAIALLLTGAVTPLIAPIIDKFGVRFLAHLIVLPTFAGLFLLAYTTSFLTLVVALFIIRLFTSFMLINAQTITTYWWVNRKGYAVSITSSIGNLALIWPTLLSLLHQQAFNGDWRATIRVEAYILGVLGSVAAVFTLNQPEKYGRLPDGKVPAQEAMQLDPLVAVIPVKAKATPADEAAEATRPEESNTSAPPSAPFFIPSAADSPVHSNSAPDPMPAPAPELAHPSAPTVVDITPSSSSVDEVINVEVNWHWRDALQTIYFWSVNGSLYANYLLWGGFSFSFSAIIDESNIETVVGFDVSSFIFIPIAIAVIISMMFVGRIFDRAKNKCRCMLLGVLMCQLALAAILSFPSVAETGSKPAAYIILLFYSIVYGTMNSVQTIAFSVVLSFAFGRSHNGAIYGASTLLNQFSLALGPILFSLWKDGTGSYRGAIVTVQVLSVLAGLAIYFTPLPDPSKRKHIIKEVEPTAKANDAPAVTTHSEAIELVNPEAAAPEKADGTDQAAFLSPEIAAENELPAESQPSAQSE